LIIALIDARNIEEALENSYEDLKSYFELAEIIVGYSGKENVQIIIPHKPHEKIADSERSIQMLCRNIPYSQFWALERNQLEILGLFVEHKFCSGGIYHLPSYSYLGKSLFLITLYDSDESRILKRDEKGKDFLQIIIDFLKFIDSKKMGEAQYFNSSGELSDLNIQIAKLLKNKKTRVVLIEGENGVGKSTLARFIHKNRNPPETPFFNIPCSSSVTETELKEIFYSQDNDIESPKGFITTAGGTIYLDNIHRLSRKCQDVAYEAIQKEKEKTAIPYYFMASSLPQLEHMVDEGKFRIKLWHEFKENIVQLPALKNYPIENLAALIQNIWHFAFVKNLHYSIPKFPKKIIKKLKEKKYFPNNIRGLKKMLENVAEKIMASTNLTGSTSQQEKELEKIFQSQFENDSFAECISKPTNSEEVMSVETLNHMYSMLAYQACSYNKRLTADKLQVSLPTLRKYLEENHD
jgi:DNA-binding NtrC family response regulator